jgi:hypothetical protein
VTVTPLHPGSSRGTVEKLLFQEHVSVLVDDETSGYPALLLHAPHSVPWDTTVFSFNLREWRSCGGHAVNALRDLFVRSDVQKV